MLQLREVTPRANNSTAKKEESITDQNQQKRKIRNARNVDHDRRDCAHYPWTDGLQRAHAPRLDSWSVTLKERNRGAL
jgi:hypothetical protein